MLLALLLPLTLAAPRLDSYVTDRADELARLALKQGNEPRAAAALIHLHGLLDEVDDLNLLAEPYSALLYRRSTDPFVRVMAQAFLADVERARGKTVRAKELVADLGFVQDWYVVGSFDNEGKGGCDTDFGPEAASDLRASYPAAGREVGWRRPNAKSADGAVDLSVALRPSNEAVGYALTFLQASEESKATLSVGASGAFRLWVNNVKVLTSDRYNGPHPDQRIVEVKLRRGLNRVLLKVCQASGQYGFALRAVGPRGPVTVVLPETVPPLEKGVAPQPVVLPTLAETLERQVKASPTNAELRADYSTVLAFTRTFPETEKWPEAEAARASLQKPTDPSLAVHAASLADDANERRHFLEQALALDPKHVGARVQLAQLELSREHPGRALALAEDLLRENPRFAPAWVVKVRALDALGEKVASFRAAEDAFAVLPVVPIIAREAIASSRRADRLEEAVARARMALALRFDDVNTRRALAGTLADLGRVDDAVEQYRKVLALDPFDLGAVLRLAELLSANDKLAEARATFELARSLAADDPEVWEREGRSLLHANQRDAALASFQHSLTLRPQNPALKEMLRSLRGDDETGGVETAFALAGLLDEAKKSTSTDDAVMLADVHHVKVQTSGLASHFQQLVVKVQTQRGVESFRTLPISWSPDRQEIRVLKARITKPDGSIIDSFAEQDRNINEPWTGMYYDARARVLTFTALAPGDVLEVQWRLDDTSSENLLSDYWGDVDMIQGTTAKKHYRYVVDMPSARKLYWNEKSTLPALKQVTTVQGERTRYQFDATDVARVVPEPEMPGWAEVASLLHLSTYASWEGVGRYYQGLVRDQLVPNDELRKTVETTLKGVDRKDDAKVVAALYGFVVTNTRYVALEFGIHGYKPYRVDRVLARRFGDCKDKASLIHAMLKVAGVDSRLVLLRMRHLGALPGDVASLAAFNHAIVYVPKLNLYLDGTAEFYGSRELPTADRVANALIVEPDGPSRFVTTPEAQPTDNLTTISLEVALKPDGSASGKGTFVATGQSAPETRRAYETVATRTTVFEQQWAQSFPGVQAQQVTVSDPKALEQPATVTFAMTMPRYAEAGPGLLKFFPFGAGRAFTQAMAPLAERTWDVMFPGVWSTVLHYTYVVPAGWAVTSMPTEVREESAFGSLLITSKREGSKLVVDGVMTLARARIGAKEYPAFRAWLMQVDQQFGRKVVLQRQEQTASR
jgi:tetratricopeptide (TPR) repeat protein